MCVCREGQCVSAGLWRMMGEEAVGVVTVLGPWRTVRREAKLKQKAPLYFPSTITEWYLWGEQGTDVGKDRDPHSFVPTDN